MGNGNVHVSTKCLHSCNQLATINCYNRMVTIKHTRVSDVDCCLFLPPPLLLPPVSLSPPRWRAAAATKTPAATAMAGAKKQRSTKSSGGNSDGNGDNDSNISDNENEGNGVIDGSAALAVAASCNKGGSMGIGRCPTDDKTEVVSRVICLRFNFIFMSCNFA